MKKMYFSEKSTEGEYIKEGEHIWPPSKIIYMKYLLILLGRMFLTLKHAVINIYKNSVKTIFYKKIYKIQALLKTCFEN